MHVFAVLAFLWSVKTHRSLIAATYGLLVLESVLIAGLPVATGYAIDGAMGHDLRPCLLLAAAVAAYAFVYTRRMQLDTVAFDGAINVDVAGIVVQLSAKAADVCKRLKP